MLVCCRQVGAYCCLSGWAAYTIFSILCVCCTQFLKSECDPWRWYDRYYWTLHFNLHSRLQACKKVKLLSRLSCRVFFLFFCSFFKLDWHTVETCVICLVHWILRKCNFVEEENNNETNFKVSLYLDIYRQISFKLTVIWDCYALHFDDHDLHWTSKVYGKSKTFSIFSGIQKKFSMLPQYVELLMLILLFHARERENSADNKHYPVRGY